MFSWNLPPATCTFGRMTGVFNVLLRLHGGETDTEIRVSTESWSKRRKISRVSWWDSNPRPFDHESFALPLSYHRSPHATCTHNSVSLTQLNRRTAHSVTQSFLHTSSSFRPTVSTNTKHTWHTDTGWRVTDDLQCLAALVHWNRRVHFKWRTRRGSKTSAVKLTEDETQDLQHSAAWNRLRMQQGTD